MYPPIHHRQHIAIPFEIEKPFHFRWLTKSLRHWSEKDLVEAGVLITPALVTEALTGYWEAYSQGFVGHKKAYLPFSKDSNSWKERAHIGFFREYSGTEDLHFAPANTELGEPLRHVDITLRNKKTRKRLMSLEGVAISDGRTDWLALACIGLFLKSKHEIEIFLFGAGKVAEAVILSLDSDVGERIKRVAVLSHHGKSNYKLVEKLGSQVKFDLLAVHDRELLRTAKLVITATSANRPVFETQEIPRNAVTLALGVDELPADYIPFVMNEDGILVADDMESFGADSLAHYYASNDLKLTKDGRDDGIRNYVEVLNDPTLIEKIERLDRPASFPAAGLASLDLAVAAHVYETLMPTSKAR